MYGENQEFRMTLLTRQQAAKMLQVSTRQLDRFIAAGLPVVRLNSSVRIREEDLRRWIDAKVTTAKQNGQV